VQVQTGNQQQLEIKIQLLRKLQFEDVKSYTLSQNLWLEKIFNQYLDGSPHVVLQPQAFLA